MDIPLFEEEEPGVSSFVHPLDWIPPHYQMSPSVVVPALSDDVPGPSRLSTPALQLHWEETNWSQIKAAQQPSANSETPFRNPCGQMGSTPVQTVFCEWFELLPLSMHIYSLITYTDPQCIIAACWHVWYLPLYSDHSWGKLVWTPEQYTWMWTMYSL